jgi:hypothetical protein
MLQVLRVLTGMCNPLWGIRTDFGAFSTDKLLVLSGVTAMSIKCPSGDSSEMRNFQQSTHLSGMKK